MRVSLAIAPATRRPIRDALAPVAVIVGAATEADAVASGLIALGTGRGPALARDLRFEVLFVSRSATAGW